MQRRLLIVMFVLGASACADLQPAAPTDFERQPVLVIHPITPIRFSNSGSLDYLVPYAVLNPKSSAISDDRRWTGAVAWTKRDHEVRLVGVDGSAYQQDSVRMVGWRTR